MVTWIQKMWQGFMHSKKERVKKFIRDNSGKYNGVQITEKFDMWRGPPDFIFESLESEGFIKWDKINQVWKYVGNNRSKSKKRKNKI